VVEPAQEVRGYTERGKYLTTISCTGEENQVTASESKKEGKQVGNINYKRTRKSKSLYSQRQRIIP